MRVLHVAETVFGGVGTYINLVAMRQMQDLGAHSTLVVSPDAGVFQLRDVPRDRIRTFTHRGRSPVTFLRMIVSVIRACREFRPDVIHLHSSFAGFLVRPLVALRLIRQPVVYCSHGWAFSREMSTLKIRLLQLTERVLASCCDAIVCISRFDVDEGIRAGISERKLVLISNGVTSESPKPAEIPDWNEQRLKVLFVGRLDRQKGFDILVEAAELARDVIHVRAAGAAVVDATELDGLSDNIEMLGWLSPQQLEAQLQACDVLAVPSRWEGFGLVAIEAMRAGRPVVAAATGGLKEIVRHEQTGLLLSSPTPLAFAKALSGLDRDTCRRMGSAGREVFQREYSFERTFAQLTALYHELHARKPREK